MEEIINLIQEALKDDTKFESFGFSTRTAFLSFAIFVETPCIDHDHFFSCIYEMITKNELLLKIITEPRNITSLVNAHPLIRPSTYDFLTKLIYLNFVPEWNTIQESIDILKSYDLNTLWDFKFSEPIIDYLVIAVPVTYRRVGEPDFVTSVDFFDIYFGSFYFRVDASGSTIDKITFLFDMLSPSTFEGNLWHSAPFWKDICPGYEIPPPGENEEILRQARASLCPVMEKAAKFISTNSKNQFAQRGHQSLLAIPSDVPIRQHVNNLHDNLNKLFSNDTSAENIT